MPRGDNNAHHPLVKAS